MGRRAETFDGQADIFDERAGLPPSVGRDVALAALELVAASPRDAVLEIGAGTGEIGRHLAALPVCYLGIDLSRGMLGVFKGKLGEASARALAVQADCDRPWPVRDRSIAAVFASRVAHLLDADRVVGEAMRVCRPGGYLLVGRTARDEHSLKSRLRHRRRVALARGGIAPRDGTEGTRRLLDRCVARGATRLESRRVASWTGTTTADRIISGWEALPALGAHRLPAEARAAILRELRDWARLELGDPHRAERFTEWYTIEGVRLQ